MEQNNKVVLRKIPLEIFIDVLMDIYVQGVDFVDIIGTNDEIQDTIGVMFTKEYVSEEAKQFFDEDEEPKNIDVNLLDANDLNQII